MTSRERLLAAMKCQPVDRVPIYIRGLFVYNEKRIKEKDGSFLPLIEAVKEDADYYQWWPYATSWEMFFIASGVRVKEEEICLSDKPKKWIYRTSISTPKGELVQEYTRPEGQPGYVTKHLIQNEEDAEKVKAIPYQPLRPDVSIFFDYEKRVGDKGFIMTGIDDAIERVSTLLGSELLAIWSIEKRKIILELLDIFTERIKGLADYFITQGVGPVFDAVGPEQALPPLQSPEDFEDFVFNYDRKIIRLVQEKGGIFHLHSHGKLKAVLKKFAEMGMNCLHPLESPPMGDVTLTEGRAILGDKVCIEGNIQIGDIFTEEPALFRKRVKETVEEGKKIENFILCPTASPYLPVLNETALSNYISMVKIGHQLGTY
ncbi:MAG: hypothetical protein KAX20_02475 [Candidatus Omnitrophica bacterium]|nr:hypothetical protein [Candidatus Omnitrophota bacterium]